MATEGSESAPELDGFIDEVDPRGFIYGWCAATTSPFGPRRVSILVDGASSLDDVVCDLERPDLAAAGIGDGRHGFEMELPASMIRVGATSSVRLRDSESGKIVGQAVTVTWGGAEAPARPSAALASGAREGNLRLAWLSGAPFDPCHTYRVVHMAAAARALGHGVQVFPAEEAALHRDRLLDLDALVLWRASVTDTLAATMQALRGKGVIILVDVDAAVDVHLAALADAGMAATPELALALRAADVPAHLVPSGFDDAALRKARRAARTRPEAGDTLRIFCRRLPKGLETWLGGRPDCVLVQASERVATCDVSLLSLEPADPTGGTADEQDFVAASLAGVPTIASSAGPLSRLIRAGETGLLVTTQNDWLAALTSLLDDGALRRRMGQAAFHDVLRFAGPERRQEMLAGVLAQIRPGRAAAYAFELSLHRAAAPVPPLPRIPNAKVVYSADLGGEAEVTVVVPLHNYAAFVTEALDSAWDQDIRSLDLVVVDDASTDGSLNVVQDWTTRKGYRFNRLVLIRNDKNAGLGFTRNAGFAAAETPFVMLLDADNRLRPGCVGACLAAVRNSGAAYAYPRIAQFGGSHEVTGGQPYWPARFVGGNFIDAMALVSKSAWAAVGGYHHIRFGWEDYDFWCRLAERGLWGVPVSDVLAEYRVHAASMLHQTTLVDENMKVLIGDMRARHPWLDVAGVHAAYLDRAP